MDDLRIVVGIPAIARVAGVSYGIARRMVETKTMPGVRREGGRYVGVAHLIRQGLVERYRSPGKAV